MAMDNADKAQLDRIERMVERQNEDLRDMKNQINEWRLKVEVRLDRVEQSHANMTWLFRAVLVAALSALMIGIVNLAPRVFPAHSDAGSKKDLTASK